MKVYTTEEDAELIETVYLCTWDVTWRATEVCLWFRAVKWGLGYVDLVRVEGDRIISTETRRYYGPIWIKFKEARNESSSHNPSAMGV